MSPQLLELIDAAARSGARVWVIEIQGQQIAPVPDAVEPATGSRENCPPPAGPTALQRLFGEIAEVKQAMKLAEWAAWISSKWDRRISERELERAVKAGALVSSTKGSGKDHKAVVATPDALVAYLTSVAAVHAGTEPKPAWWNDVRRGSNAAIS